MTSSRIALAALAVGLCLTSCSAGGATPSTPAATPSAPVTTTVAPASVSPTATASPSKSASSLPSPTPSDTPTPQPSPTTARPAPVHSSAPTSRPSTGSSEQAEHDVDDVDTADESEEEASSDEPLPSEVRAKAARSCRDEVVEPRDEGHCAETAIELLDDAGYYSGKLGDRFGTKAINWTLVYQRAHGLEDNGTIDADTWEALINGAEEIPDEIPDSCRDDGVVLCISKAHHKLRWMRDGDVKKTIQVRVAGWQEDAEGDWRLHETPTGEWEVYDKSRQPCSERYGCKLMPFSTMFDPSMYVHGSKTFAEDGYAGASHGCINALMDDAEWVFDRTPIGAKVVIYAD